MEKQPRNRCDEICELIDRGLAEPIMTPAELERQNALDDFEFCLLDRIEKGELSEVDALEAMDAYKAFLDLPEHQRRLVDPNQGVLF